MGFEHSQSKNILHAKGNKKDTVIRMARRCIAFRLPDCDAKSLEQYTNILNTTVDRFNQIFSQFLENKTSSCFRSGFLGT